MSRIGILGSGTWGIALARMLVRIGHEVIVWSAIGKEIDELQTTHIHRDLPGVQIPEEIRYTKEIREACGGVEILLVAVPSVYVRDTVRKAASFVSDEQIIVNVAKGIEPDTLYTMTRVIGDELEKAGKRCSVAALSGPTHAEEVARDLHTTIVSACRDTGVAKRIQDVFMNSCLRVYTNSDVEGVEISGAVKNIMALAAGIARGLGLGDNARAALITRGLAEITRLGKAMGCREQTFNGLAGVGDLIVTATSVHSRNNRCGELIGKGMKPEDAIREIGMVVEGINALPAAMELARRYRVSMPIVEAVNAVIHEGKDPKDAVTELMNRRKKSEFSTSVDYEYELLQEEAGE